MFKILSKSESVPSGCLSALCELTQDKKLVHFLLKNELWISVLLQDTHGLCVIEADLVDVWRMEGEHLEYNEAEGENVRLNCHLLVLYHLEI
jgi:hypothetical protein